MEDTMKKIWHYFPYIILAVVILFFVSLALVFKSDSVRIDIDEVKSLNTGWSFDAQEIASLPINLHVEKNTSYTVKTTLGEDFTLRKVVLVRSSLSNIEVHLDGELIYQKQFGETQFPPYASMWHFIEIPGHSENLELSLTFFSPYTDMSGIVNEIHYGTHAEVYAYLFNTYGFRLMIGSFVLFAGLVILTLSLFFFRTQNKGFMYIGLFTTFLSLWILAESRMLQWVIGDVHVLGSLAYVMLPLFPIPMLVYLKNNVLKKHKKFTEIFIGLFSVTLMAVIILHATGIADFFETVIVSQVMLVLGIVFTLVYTFYEYRTFKNNNAARVFKIIAFLMIFAAIELILFLINDFTNTSVSLLIGVALLSVILLYNYVKYLIYRLKMSYQNEIYQKLAYFDQLTGARNRLGYEEDFEVIFNDTKKRASIRLIYFDFDDLKYINDTKGHLEGDIVLKRGFEVIRDVFGSQGLCYRLGGDEFACIHLDEDKNIYLNKIEVFEKMIEKLNKELGHSFRVSIGSSTYDSTDLKPSDLMKRADDSMYFNKCEHKGNCERIRPNHLT